MITSGSWPDLLEPLWNKVIDSGIDDCTVIGIGQHTKYSYPDGHVSYWVHRLSWPSGAKQVLKDLIRRPRGGYGFVASLPRAARKAGFYIHSGSEETGIWIIKKR